MHFFDSQLRRVSIIGDNDLGLDLHQAWLHLGKLILLFIV